MARDEGFLVLKNITKKFGEVTALDNVSLTIKQSELFSLLGSSGCGKSTLLRIIAGFEKPDKGNIILDGQDISDLPPYLRPLNIMFQNYALFPHLNVYKNIEFGLKEEKLEQNLIEERINEALTLLELSALQKRKINEISGGQQQRVALARCLVKKPKLLLLDEPLAALDKKLRIQTQFELVNLQFKLGITFIIVTHDQEEAMSLSDRMAVMQQGNILQIGTPVEVYETPGNEYIANFIGTANIFEINYNLENKLFANALNAFIESTKNITTNKFLLRPEKIEISKFSGEENIQINKCIGTVKEIAYLGSYTKYLVKTDKATFYVFQQNKFFTENLNIKWDDKVVCSWNENSIFPIND